MTAPTFTKTSPPASGVSLTPIDTTVLKLVRGGTLPAVGALLRNGSAFSMIDTRPLRWHQGAGGGGGGTTVTWNPADLNNTALSGGNLIASATGTQAAVRGSATQSTGFFEVLCGGSGGWNIGLADLLQSLTSGYIGDGTYKSASYYSGATVFGPGGDAGGNLGGNGIPTCATGDVIGIRLYATSMEALKNGVPIYAWTALPSGALYPIIGFGSASGVGTLNVGASAFSHQPLGSTSWDGSRTATGTMAWSTLDKDASITVSGATNLIATGTTGDKSVRANAPQAAANGFFEATVNTLGAGTMAFGLTNYKHPLSVYLGWDQANSIEYRSGGAIVGTNTSTNGVATFAVNDKIGVWRKADGSVSFYKNGTLLTNRADVPLGPLYPSATIGAASDQFTLNLGATAFSFQPTGSTSWDGSRTT